MLKIKWGMVLVMVALVLAPVGVKAVTVENGDLIKATGAAVYYMGEDGRRYVFPNGGVYFSWYEDFSKVKKISEAELVKIPLGTNITYRPGVKLVQIRTLPKVYAVSRNGELRWLENETVARELYGQDWNKKIDFIPETFFSDYKLGQAIKTAGDYNRETIMSEAPTIMLDKGISRRWADLFEIKKLRDRGKLIKPVIHLPYLKDRNLPQTMTPMGETIDHPKPQNPEGHGGIDFQWETPSEVPTIVASMDGEVTAIIDNDGHVGAKDVLTKNGYYGVDYTELGSVRADLKVGDRVRVGDVIGTPQHPIKITDWPNFRMIHWQFGYVSDWRNGVADKLCPMTYFAAEDKVLMESLWAGARRGELKRLFPYVCSGDYLGKDD